MALDYTYRVGELTFNKGHAIGRGMHSFFVSSGFHKGKAIGLRKAVAIKRSQRIRRDAGFQQEVAFIQKASAVIPTFSALFALKLTNSSSM